MAGSTSKVLPPPAASAFEQVEPHLWRATAVPDLNDVFSGTVIPASATATVVDLSYAGGLTNPIEASGADGSVSITSGNWVLVGPARLNVTFSVSSGVTLTLIDFLIAPPEDAGASTIFVGNGANVILQRIEINQAEMINPFNALNVAPNSECTVIDSLLIHLNASGDDTNPAYGISISGSFSNRGNVIVTNVDAAAGAIGMIIQERSSDPRPVLSSAGALQLCSGLLVQGGLSGQIGSIDVEDLVIVPRTGAENSFTPGPGVVGICPVMLAGDPVVNTTFSFGRIRVMGATAPAGPPALDLCVIADFTTDRTAQLPAEGMGAPFTVRAISTGTRIYGQLDDGVVAVRGDAVTNRATTYTIATPL